MSMMMPPDPSAAPGLPIPPGGGDPGAGGPSPLDALNQGPIPAGGGIGDLISALSGGPNGGPGPGGPGPGDGGPDVTQMSSVEHIQEAMKHLMMALASEPDESHGAGIVKGMGALQAILGGKQKENQDQQSQQIAATAGG